MKLTANILPFALVMVLGQSAATAACQAIDDTVPVQHVKYAKLRERLLADKQVLEWQQPAEPASSQTGNR